MDGMTRRAQAQARNSAASITVRDALDAYLTVNGFTLDAYDAPTFEISLLGRRCEFPNSPDRQWAIALHDLHHVATGYGTDFAGEAEIAAWELAAGCRTPVVYVLNVIAVGIGLFLAPVRVMRAWVAGLRGRTLYRLGLERDACLELEVHALRVLLGISEVGLADARPAGPEPA